MRTICAERSLTGCGVLLIGEQPTTPDGDPLAGLAKRIATLAGVTTSQVLATPRCNLLPYGPWSMSQARRAAALLDESGPPVPFVLLGRRVASAFGFASLRFFTHATTAHGRSVTLIPHPSRRCRIWNDHENERLAQRVLGAVMQ